MSYFPKLVTAEISEKSTRFYLVDRDSNFIPEVKAFSDEKASRGCSPNTILGLCIRLRWYYLFLDQRDLEILQVKLSDLTDFTLWLSNPHRQSHVQPKPLRISTINQILHAVANLYNFLVRQGRLAESPVVYQTVSRNWKASIDGDLLAHTRRQGQQTVQRMELVLKQPRSLAKTVSPDDFDRFINSIQIGTTPDADPSGFRDRIMIQMFRESGLRLGEMLGIRLEDLDFSSQSVHIRFRPDNANGARAKAGYGRDRFVDLSPELFGLLDIYLSEVWINTNCHSDYLWLVLKENAVNKDQQSTFGKPLNASAVNQMFAYYSARSGVKTHPHMLRHTHATDLVRSFLSQDQSVDWKFIADRLGHSSVVTTMKFYVHLTKEDNKTGYKSYLQRKEQADAKRRQRHSQGNEME